MNVFTFSPTATARGVRGAVTGESGAVSWEAKPGGLLPPGCHAGTPVHLFGKLDDVLAAFELLVAEGDRAREVCK